jgi:hypothetical protein
MLDDDALSGLWGDVARMEGIGVLGLYFMVQVGHVEYLVLDAHR